MTIPKRFYVDGSFGQIHCRGVFPEGATKPGIICCHMSPKSSQSFESLLPLLAKDRFAVALDYPGYGASDPAPETPHVAIADYANAVWEVVDALPKAQSVHLLGYHTGSMVVAEAACQRIEQAISVVMISAPVFTDEEQRSLASEYSPIPLDEAGTRFKVMWERIIQYRGPGMTLEMAALSFAENLGGGENYEHGHRAAYGHAGTFGRRLTELEQPTLVINPNDDCFEQSKRTDKLLKNGRRIDLPDWGYGLLHANAAGIAEIATSFISEVENI